MVFLTAICLAQVALIGYVLRSFGQERKDWTHERRLLVTRIQSPELAPLLAPHPEGEDVNDGPPTEQEEILSIIQGEPVEVDQ